MAPLYVVEQGAKIRKERRRLVVEKDDQPLQTIPLIKIDQVLIFGNVGITTPALTWLMSQDIEVVFCDRHGRYKGRVVGPTGGHSQLRRLQYRRVDTPAFALNTARAIVKAKIHNSRTMLRRYRRKLDNPQLDGPVERLQALAHRADRVQTVNSLLGVEGIAAAVYFEALPHLFKHNHWRFSKRIRRPPTDPINVLLSFGYTLLARQMEAAVERVGLDPYLGCLHADSYNRPSMALDITEEFRSIVTDSVVLRCINSGLITPDNFSPQPNPERPLLLDDAGRNRFIQEFEARLAVTFTHPALNQKVTYRRCFELQARDMARAIQADGLYQPFTVR
ncbi:MAG: CRISPR-associated endonuclease Cas1 [Chloroflexi bacterium]|nr:MAG: CRISPR-associated endonuclease Cas1 [Chloroflexota bacterium]